MNNILIINLGPVYPIRAMNQMRTHNMIRVLSQTFKVDLATTVNCCGEKLASINALQKYNGKFFSLGSLKPSNNFFKKRIIQLGERMLFYLIGIDSEVFESWFIRKKLIDIIKKNNYQIIISNYWENSLFFKELKGVYKILDPHYAVEENITVFNLSDHPIFQKFFQKRRLEKNLKLERIVVNNSDLILPLSKNTYNIFKRIAPQKELLLVPDGSDIEYFSNFPVNPEENTILFYGSMGSKQNMHAFFRFYDKILPEIKKVIPEVRILIVGDCPSHKIKSLHNGRDIIVTGYVEDVRPWLAKAWLKILPLELGSGFRGRIVELMSMGIPVIGTHNALDCIGFENGKEGIVSDEDDELISYSIRVLIDKNFRNYISKNAKDFAVRNYSLENTFGKLRNLLIKKFIIEQSN